MNGLTEENGEKLRHPKYLKMFLGELCELRKTIFFINFITWCKSLKFILDIDILSLIELSYIILLYICKLIAR